MWWKASALSWNQTSLLCLFGIVTERWDVLYIIAAFDIQMVYGRRLIAEVVAAQDKELSYSLGD